MTDRARVETKQEIADRIRAENPEPTVASFGKGQTPKVAPLQDDAREQWIADAVEIEHQRQTRESEDQTKRDERLALIAAVESGKATNAQMQAALALLLRRDLGETAASEQVAAWSARR